jgi:hypothetical protein
MNVFRISTFRIVTGATLFICSIFHLTAAMAQTEAERFERSLEQIRQNTLILANPEIPPDQRVTLDYGGYLSFAFLSLDDNTGNNHVLRQSEVVGYARANFDGAHEFFIRYRTGYRDFNQGDSFSGRGSEPIDGDLDTAYYKFDLQRALAAYKGDQITGNVVVKGGRDLVYWGNGLTLSQTIDGATIDASWEQFSLSAIGGVTPTRTVDFDASRPAFDYNTKRGFYGAIASVDVGRHRPYMYGLIQRDYNEDDQATIANVPTHFDYNSFYIGIGCSGALSDRWLYATEAVYEGGRSISNSYVLDETGRLIPVPGGQVHDDIQAWAADFRMDYLVSDERRTRFSGEVILASGDHDRTNTSETFGGNKPGTKDHAFNGFGLLNAGLAFGPTVSNMAALRVGASTFPFLGSPTFKRMQLGADVFVFNKMLTDAPIDEPTFDHRYLGWEPDFYLNWQITSDVTFAARYGVFFPNSDAILKDDARQFVFLSVTYSF